MNGFRIILCVLFWSFALLSASAGLSKKGVCITTKKGNATQWKRKVDSLNVSWHYSWGSRLPGEELPGVEFVPMIYGFWGIDDGFKKNIIDLLAAKKAGRHRHLLGFNEPDHKNQANMSVDRAIKAWPYLMKTGLRLGSPGAAHPDKEWMQQFMRKAKQQNLRVDFVAVHWYGGSNVDSLVSRLKKVHQMYGKPIWITEFAVADWTAKSLETNKHKPWRVQQFMKEALPRLDKLDFVERYAWFSGGETNKNLGPSAILKQDGSLTALGKIYAAHR